MLDAKSRFERLPARCAMWTTRLLSRTEVTPGAGGADDDESPESEGDFIGRLITAFGAADPDGGFVLRDRHTGLVVTAYAAPGGPSYGGGPRWEGGVPFELGPAPEAVRPPEERLDPLLRELRKIRGQLRESSCDGALRASMVREHARLWREVAHVQCPPGFPEVVATLEDLLRRAPRTDYERIDDSGTRGPHRVGVRGGAPFCEALSPSEVIGFYVERLESLPDDAAWDWAATATATRLFFRFEEETLDETERWVPRMTCIWRTLRQRVERSCGEPHARLLWQTLVSHAARFGENEGEEMESGHGQGHGHAYGEKREVTW